MNKKKMNVSRRQFCGQHNIQLMWLLLFGYIVFFAHSQSYAQRGESSAASQVSIVALLANYDDYDSRKVFVVGFSLMSSDGSYICLDANSAAYLILPNCLAIGSASESFKMNGPSVIERFDGHMIGIEGVFSAPESRGLYSHKTPFHSDGQNDIENYDHNLGIINNIEQILLIKKSE